MSHLSSSASFGVTALVTVAFVSIAACDGGVVPVGASEQKLQLRSDGSPTGDGSSCSFEDPNTAVSSDGNVAAKTVHKVGDTFKALDACNDCTCTAKGITCTERACGDNSTPGNPGNQGCTDEAKICPDGTAVGREGPNCEFAACPVTKGDKAECGVNLPQCPSGQDCYFVPKAQGAVCMADPCSVCPDPNKCVILESYPAQIGCN